MFLAPRQRKTTVFTRFWASANKNHGIYSVLWSGPSKNTGIYAVSSMLSQAFFWMPKAQKHCKLYDFYVWIAPKKHEKSTKIRPKNAQQGLPKRIFKSYPLFSYPEPPKTWKPQHPEGFSKRSAAPACPRVAKAMLSNHHHTARHRQNGPTPWCRGSGALATSICCETLQPAVCLHGPLLLGLSSLPFASPQMPKIPRSGHKHLSLEPWSLLFASIFEKGCMPCSTLEKGSAEDFRHLKAGKRQAWTP